MTKMLAATDPWPMGKADGVALGMMLEELKDMVVDALTEEPEDWDTEVVEEVLVVEEGVGVEVTL